MVRTEDIIIITRNTINASILFNTKKGYIGWSSCNHICMDMQDCLDMCEAAFLSEVYSDVLEAAIYILASGIKLASHADSSSGMLSNVIKHTYDLIEKCTKKIAQQEKPKRDQALNSILKEVVKNYFDGWGNWRYDLLKCGICLCDEKSATKLERLLDDLETNLEEPFYSEYIKEEESIVRYQLHRHLIGKDKTKDELYELLNVNELRIVAIQDALEDNDFNEAEKLCLEKSVLDDPKVILSRFRHLERNVY